MPQNITVTTSAPAAPIDMPTRPAWKRPWVVVVLVAAIAAAWWWSTRGAAPVARGGGPVPVVVETVALRDVPTLARSIGTVTPLAHVSVRPQVDGVLAAVYFKEGEMVTAGQRLAKIDDRTLVARLAQARAERASGEAQLVAAQAELTRMSSLASQDLVAAQALDDAKARAGQLSAAVAASEAAVVAGEVALSYAQIKSPISGRVGLRKRDAGNVVRAGVDELVAVTQLAPISVMFALPQSYLAQVARLRDGAGAAAIVVAYDQDGLAPLATGSLTVVDNAVDAATGTIAMRATFDNADGALWPGQFVTISLQTAPGAGVVAIAAKAVRQGAQGPFVFRVIDGKAAQTPITVAHEDGAVAVIASGLEAGDVIIVDGHSRVKPGSPVRVAEGAAAAAKPDTAKDAK
ncbi:MAG: efflux RND transporter periplasmic adaptor subunit [Myxococcales bacterium]|nr:efflux RND transporter periplasmic adaptor subunit [Myxococcales bacterium]